MKRSSKNPAPTSAPAPAKDEKRATPLSDRIDALRSMDLDALRKEFLAVVGRPTNAKDKDAMIARISEALVFGGKGGAPAKPGRPITKAVGAPEAKATVEPATSKAKPSPAGDHASPFTQDPRLPAPGSVIKVTHKKVEYAAKFLGADGFEYEGERFRSLSAIARKVLGGAQVNGFLWWGLIPRAAKAGTTPAPAKALAKKAKAPAGMRAAMAKAKAK